MDKGNVYPRVLGAMKQVDRSTWALADALAHDIPRTEKDLKGALEHASAWLCEHGYDASGWTLAWQRRTALMFPPQTRQWDASLGVYGEAAKGSETSADAQARMREFMEGCNGASVRPTAAAMKRFLEKPTYRYSARSFVNYILASSEETQERVADELEERRHVRDTNLQKTKSSNTQRTTRSTQDTALSSLRYLGVHLDVLAEAVDTHMEKLTRSGQLRMRKQLELDRQRIDLLLAVLNGRVPADDDLREEMAAMKQKRLEVR